MKCRSCHSPVDLVFIDLGSSPPSNAYLSASDLNKPERWYPLRVLVCTNCWLVQTEDFARRGELFSSDYAYFSSYSSTWLEHSKRYAREITARLGLNESSRVVEVASNDGYLLQYFKQSGIPCLGVEPTASTADAAKGKGIEVIKEFFGTDLASRLVKDGKAADLMVANNVLAHVPDINDFVSGFSRLLKPNGVATFEFPHLLNLVAQTEFDTVYHEHFSYLSVTALLPVFERHGLSVFDVQELPTHGGSIRVFVQKAETGSQTRSESVSDLIERERDAGVMNPNYYGAFQAKAERVKNDFLRFLLSAKAQGKSVAGYGAAAKANTLMNFAGVRPDLVKFIVDRNPSKQSKFMPGTRVPIVQESILQDEKPDYVVLFPWNLRTELATQLAYVSEWKGRLVVAVPELEIL